jgi:hydrogenase maturation protease
MKADGSPGTIYLLDAQQLLQRQANHPLSLHEVGAVEILRIMALEANPPPCLVIGIEPASLECGLEPSPLLQGRMADILQVVKEQIQDLLSQEEPEVA